MHTPEVGFYLGNKNCLEQSPVGECLGGCQRGRGGKPQIGDLGGQRRKSGFILSEAVLRVELCPSKEMCPSPNPHDMFGDTFPDVITLA